MSSTACHATQSGRRRCRAQAEPAGRRASARSAPRHHARSFLRSAHETEELRCTDTGAVPAKLNLYWTPRTTTPTETLVPAAALIPDYGLATSTTTDDAGLPGGASASFTSYTGGGADPAYGLATDTVTDPTGTALDRKTSYETPGSGAGSGYLRPTATALPSGDLTNAGKRTTTTYYGDAETRDIPCTGAPTAVNQAGMTKLVTDPTPASGTPVTTETVYDDAGRVAATRVGADDWTCLTYDGRERVISKAVPVINGAAARTVTSNYAVGGDPLTTSVTDPAGTITTVTDLLGRTVKYTDVNGTVTTTGYDQAGRAVTQTSSGAGGGTSTVTTGFDDAGKTTTVALDGKVLAQPGYDSNGELASVVYPAAAAASGSTPATGGNGMTLSGLTQNPAGRDTGSTFTVPGGSTVTDALTLSQAGRVTASTATAGGAVTAGWTYAYDAADRLTQAVLGAGTGSNAARPATTFGYGYAATGGCGQDHVAGRDSARTSATVQVGSGAVQSTVTCTDFASRLTSNTVTNPTTNAITPIAAAGAIYDSHGNSTRLGNQYWTYDGTDRVTTTTATQTAAQTGGTATTQKLTYTRDAGDRVVAQVGSGTNGVADTSTQLYGFVDGTDSPEYQLTTTKALAERYLTLPGGVLLTRRYTTTGADTWSLPNLHGDITCTTNGTGAITTSGALYDPYGQPLDPTTGTVKTTATPTTRTGPTTDAWEGTHQRGYQHTAGLNQTLMGARIGPSPREVDTRLMVTRPVAV